jgi:hypothetical protein
LVDGKECAVLVTGVEGEEACAVAAGKIEEGVEERGWQGRAEVVIVPVGNGSSGLLSLLDEVVDGLRRLSCMMGGSCVSATVRSSVGDMSPRPPRNLGSVARIHGEESMSVS